MLYEYGYELTVLGLVLGLLANPDLDVQAPLLWRLKVSQRDLKGLF